MRARRRRAAYAKVVDELDDGNSDGSDDSDLDDDLYPTLFYCLKSKSINCHLIDFSIFVLPGHLTKRVSFYGQYPFEGPFAQNSHFVLPGHYFTQ